MAVDPKGLVFGGQEGSGTAQIFQGGPSAYETTREPLRQLINIKYDNLRKQEAKQAAQKAAFDKLAGLQAKLLQNKPEIEEKFGKVKDAYVTASAQGFDPDDATTEQGRNFLQLKNDLLQAAEFDTQLSDAFTKSKQTFDREKYDFEHFTKEWDKILAQPTVEDRMAALQNANLLSLNIDPFEFVDDFTPKSVTDETPGSTYYKKVTAPTEENLDFNATAYAAAHPDHMKKIIELGLATDLDGAKAVIKERLRTNSDRRTDLTRVPDGGGMNINFGGGAGGTVGDYEITTATNPSFADPESNEVNVVKFRKAGKDLPNMSLVDNKGNAIFVKPEQLVKVKDASAPNGVRWELEGFKAKRLTGAQVAKKAGGENKISADFLAQESLEYDPETKEYISLTDTEPVTLRVSNKPGSHGEINYNTLSGLLKTDLYQYIEGQNQARRGGKGSVNTTAKKEKPY